MVRVQQRCIQTRHIFNLLSKEYSVPVIILCQQKQVGEQNTSEHDKQQWMSLQVKLARGGFDRRRRICVRLFHRIGIREWRAKLCRKNLSRGGHTPRLARLWRKVDCSRSKAGRL